MTAKARWIETGEISRLKASTRCFPRIILKIFNHATAIELVLIPPPVEAGEAPIHINKMVMRRVEICKADTFTTLNPAVLGVTALKNEIANFPPKLCSYKVL